FFKIDRFIVPKMLVGDFSGRRSEETLFVFPFDHSERGKTEAYEDIAEKLRALDFPLLFLSHLGDISYEIPGALGLYGKNIEQKKQLNNNTTAEHICLTRNDGNELYDEKLWLFSRRDRNGQTYSVGFFLDE